MLGALLYTTLGVVMSGMIAYAFGESFSTPENIGKGIAMITAAMLWPLLVVAVILMAVFFNLYRLGLKIGKVMSKTMNVVFDM
jgi:hypothetical protein